MSQAKNVRDEDRRRAEGKRSAPGAGQDSRGQDSAAASGGVACYYSAPTISIQDLAALEERGIKCFPTRPNKKPPAKWEPIRNESVSQRLERWRRTLEGTAPFLIAGLPGDKFVVVDVDHEPGLLAFVGGAIDWGDAVIVKTPSEGAYQVWCASGGEHYAAFPWGEIRTGAGHFCVLPGGGLARYKKDGRSISGVYEYVTTSLLEADALPGLPEVLRAKLATSAGELTRDLALLGVARGRRHAAGEVVIGGIVHDVRAAGGSLESAMAEARAWDKRNHPPLQNTDPDELPKMVQSFWEKDEAKPPGESKVTQGEWLVRYCEREVREFVLDQYEQAHVLLPFPDHEELRPTTSGAFREWLAGGYREAHHKPPGGEALAQCKLQVEGMCSRQVRRSLNTRVAQCGDSIIYDLANPLWRGIEITPDGWREVPLLPVFRRWKCQGAQTTPARGGDAKRLFEFVNVPEADRCLFLVAVASWFIPTIPHPVLIFFGEQGSAKTTTCRIVKRLVDPVGRLTDDNNADMLRRPKDPDELDQQLSHHWVACYDNLSHMSEWVSDTLCRAVTGGGSSRRKLYSDDDDFLRGYRRCVAVNGIGNPARRPDLLDRCLLLELAPPANMRQESELHEAAEAAMPLILGALLDAVAAAMRALPTTSREGLLRLADFHRWGRALAGPLGFSAKEFDNKYAEAVKQKWTDAARGSLLVKRIEEILDIDNKGSWKGTATELYQQLTLLGENAPSRKQEGLPGNARATSGALTTIKPLLRAIDIDVSKKRVGHDWHWEWTIQRRGSDA